MGGADLLGKIWKPEVFQGRGKKKDYFEGWYFKSVSQDEKNSLRYNCGCIHYQKS